MSVAAVHFVMQLTKLYLVDEHSNHVSQVHSSHFLAFYCLGIIS